MKDRIRELVGQAKCMAEETINRQISKNAELNAFAEKFALLIVKECIQVVDDTMTENQEMNIGLVMASAAIVAHFEVNE